MSKSVVIIPTYNELGNIENTLKKVENLEIKFDVIIVDDNSPDGTGKLVEKIINNNIYELNIYLINRKKKEGLGSAYIEGFRKALDLKYNFIFQLDCDGSHDPNKLIDLRDQLNKENADIVVGSRYIKGISVLHWPLSRLLLSIFANYYVKLVTGLKVNDSTGGFNGYNFKALNSILKNKIDFEGYAFQIQMKFIGYKIGFKIIEIPIIFKDREIGESKMSFKIFGEAFLGIIWMKFKSFFQGFKN
ncbi:MAG: polyprenol monophosphomannose synthase [Bacteroidota bacterium]|nr:polyprenol monophosphomannose synthase [Bacteroidota bacterium]